MKKGIEKLIEDIRKYLGIKTECELAFEEYEEHLKVRQRISRLYRKGIKKNDMRLAKMALERMYDMCEQKGYKCKRGDKLCTTCAFGLVKVQEELSDRGLTDKVETDIDRFRRMEEKLGLKKYRSSQDSRKRGNREWKHAQ